MKKIEVKTEQTSYVWEAIDGTRFGEEKQCKIYENTAECMIKADLKNRALWSDGGNDLLGYYGYHFFIVPKDLDDLKAMEMMYIFCCQNGGCGKETRPYGFKVGVKYILTIGECWDWMGVSVLDRFVEKITDGVFTVTATPDEQEEK